MKERPLLFTGPMVRALLDGSKTQTRRVVKAKHLPWLKNSLTNFLDGKWNQRPVPYGSPGDRLWVRENGWERPERTAKMMREGADTWAPYYFDADGLSEQESTDFKAWGFKRRPSIHMPRWGSRLTLEITGVRVERLQDISEADAEAEGIDFIRRAPDVDETLTAKEFYEALWESIHGAGSWGLNPWVWVVEFEKVRS